MTGAIEKMEQKDSRVVLETESIVLGDQDGVLQVRGKISLKMTLCFLQGVIKYMIKH